MLRLQTYQQGTTSSKCLGINLATRKEKKGMDIPMEHLKNAEITMKDGELTVDTDVLDGEAKDSPVFMESNETVQFKTPDLPGGAYGGRNDLNG